MLRVQAVASRLAAQTRALVTVRRFGAAADHGAHGHGHGPKEIDFSDPEALTKRFSELTNNIGKPRHHVQHQEVYDPSKHYNTSGGSCPLRKMFDADTWEQIRISGGYAPTAPAPKH